MKTNEMKKNGFENNCAETYVGAGQAGIRGELSTDMMGGFALGTLFALLMMVLL